VLAVSKSLAIHETAVVSVPATPLS